MVQWNDKGRFHVIHKYRTHIQVYAFLSLAGICWSIYSLAFDYLLFLLCPFLISCLYVIPFFKRKRIRDIHYIKIFLIAIVWSWVSVIPVLIETGISKEVLIYSFEKAIFLLAITIPFDVRDFSIDMKAGLKTLPQVLGVQRSYQLCLLLLVISSLILYFLIGIKAIGFLVANLLIGIIICVSKEKSSDYMFSGLLDGSFIVRAILFLLFSSVIFQ